MRRRKPVEPPELPELPICDLCLRPFSRRPGTCQITCDECRAWLIEDERRAPGSERGYLPPEDRILPRQLQRLYGERFVEAANLIISRILAELEGRGFSHSARDAP